MSSSREIQAALLKLTDRYKEDTVGIMAGTVKSVDEDASTCICIIENNVELPNVNLQAGVCDGLQIIPEDDSTVLILLSKYNQPYIVKFGDIKKYYLQVGDSSFTVFDKAQNNGEQIVLNDGSYKGLVKVEELVKKLNALEDDLNNFKDALIKLLVTGGPIPEPGNGPSQFQIKAIAALSSYYGQKFTDTVRQDLENETITHGK
jgi:hypothetical protein